MNIQNIFKMMIGISSLIFSISFAFLSLDLQHFFQKSLVLREWEYMSSPTNTSEKDKVSEPISNSEKELPPKSFVDWLGQKHEGGGRGLSLDDCSSIKNNSDGSISVIIQGKNYLAKRRDNGEWFWVE